MPLATKTLFGDRYVPLKEGVEQLGGKVEWDNAAKRATVHVNGKTILVTMANNAVEVNGSIVNLAQTPLVDDGILYVGEAFFTDVVGQSVH